MTRRVVLSIALTYLFVIVFLLVWHEVLGIDLWYFRRDCC